MKIEASELTEHIGYWLRLLSNNVSYAFSRKLNATGVTVAEWVILREMYSKEGIISPSVIADLTGLTRGAISKLISRLLEKRLISRRESATDRRYQDVKLTEKAIALVPELASLADQNDEAFFASLSKAEQHQLKSLLQKLADYHQLKTIPIH